MSLFELRSDTPALPTRPLRGAIGATAARGSGAGGGTPWWTLALVAVLAAVGLAVVGGRVLVNGDGMWHLIWGRALLDGSLESFALGPTPHPSLLVLAAATSTLGDDASYRVTYVLFGPLAFGVLAAASFEVARRLSSRVAGVVAVLILTTSAGVLAVASAARYDIAFAALVMTAVALEMARPRRGVAPLVVLAAAGLVRPEAWFLAGAYWLWLAPRLSWPARFRMAALAALAPVLWAAMDALVMGDPLYSLHITDEYSDALYRQYSELENLEVAGRNLLWYLGVFPLLLLPPAVVLLARDRPRVALAPLGALAVTLGLFLLLLARGMASSERYLLVPVCVLAILAAIAVDGRGRRTPRRVALGVFLAVILSLQLATRTDVYGTVSRDSATAYERYESARALVQLPGVGAALRDCAAVSMASGKMRHWFGFYSGRPPAELVSDSRGQTRPDLFVAPANAEVAKAVLTRKRFDADASFRVPPGLDAVRRNPDWVLYASPTAGCTSDLR